MRSECQKVDNASNEDNEHAQDHFRFACKTVLEVTEAYTLKQAKKAVNTANHST